MRQRHSRGGGVENDGTAEISLVVQPGRKALKYPSVYHRQTVCLVSRYRFPGYAGSTPAHPAMKPAPGQMAGKSAIHGVHTGCATRGGGRKGR